MDVQFYAELFPVVVITFSAYSRFASLAVLTYPVQQTETLNSRKSNNIE